MSSVAEAQASFGAARARPALGQRARRRSLPWLLLAPSLLLLAVFTYLPILRVAWESLHDKPHATGKTLWDRPFGSARRNGPFGMPTFIPLERGTRFRRGAGCEGCRHTGYVGRMAIYEICLINEPMRRAIVEKRDGGELKQIAIAQGMETLRADGWRRVAQGKTTIEEVVRVTQNDEIIAETSLESAPAPLAAEPIAV